MNQIRTALALPVVLLSFLWLAGGRFARIAATAQFAYVVLFSFSFFFDGYSGLMITVAAIITLAVLMIVTATTDLSTVFQWKPKPSAQKTPLEPLVG